MTNVLIGCGVSGLLMFTLFFILPNLDRLKEITSGKKMESSTRAQVNSTASNRKEVRNPAA